RARLNLLVEHSGRPARPALRELRDAADWVAVLDRWASEPTGALRPHPMTSRIEENPLLSALSSGDAGLPGEDAFEAGPSPKERLGAGLRRLRRLLGAPFRWRRVARLHSPAAL